MTIVSESALGRIVLLCLLRWTLKGGKRRGKEPVPTNLYSELNESIYRRWVCFKSNFRNLMSSGRVPAYNRRNGREPRFLKLVDNCCGSTPTPIETKTGTRSLKMRNQAR